MWTQPCKLCVVPPLPVAHRMWIAATTWTIVSRYARWTIGRILTWSDLAPELNLETSARIP